MVDVRFELTTNNPCSAVVAICEGLINSPLGYRYKVNQSPTQSKPHNTVPTPQRSRRSEEGRVFYMDCPGLGN